MAKQFEFHNWVFIVVVVDFGGGPNFKIEIIV
jgi:hypothetical protein